MLCEYCKESLRRCKNDFVGRRHHFKCIEIMRKIKWDEDFEKLRLYLESKCILLKI
jgi:hypothetical protein